MCTMYTVNVYVQFTIYTYCVKKLYELGEVVPPQCTGNLQVNNANRNHMTQTIMHILS